MEINVAWAAGFYEGEGHLTKATRPGGPLVAIQQCNKEPLDALQLMFGGTVRGPRMNKGSVKPVWVWQLNTHKESRHFIYQISPWLSDKRLSDALCKIDRYADIVSVRYTYCSKGHDKDVLGYRLGHNGGRICKTCESEYKRKYYLEKKYGEQG